MSKRTLVSSGSAYEPQIGFSRAVRIGSHIAVAGTASVAEDGSTAYPGDAYRQTLRCLDIIEQAIREAGGRPEDVIRTRVFMTRVEDWEAIARAHGERFHDIRPACSFLVVAGLLQNNWLVEIEADAILPQKKGLP